MKKKSGRSRPVNNRGTRAIIKKGFTRNEIENLISFQKTRGLLTKMSKTSLKTLSTSFLPFAPWATFAERCRTEKANEMQEDAPNFQGARVEDPL